MEPRKYQLFRPFQDRSNSETKFLFIIERIPCTKMDQGCSLRPSVSPFSPSLSFISFFLYSSERSVSYRSCRCSFDIKRRRKVENRFLIWKNFDRNKGNSMYYGFKYDALKQKWLNERSFNFKFICREFIIQKC